MFLTFQSSPALSGRCNYVITSSVVTTIEVSILTGPFGPVQLGDGHPDRQRLGVSILTGPFRPVQQTTSHQTRFLLGRFNPHRPFQAGATRPLGQIRLAVPSSFNPHRPFQAGATTIPDLNPGRFQVSILTGPFGPVQRQIQGGKCQNNVVSILTGPFGPVQLLTKTPIR